MASYDPPTAISRPIAHRGTLGRIVNGLFFLVILVSPFVLYEPSPYEAAFVLLAFVAIIAGFRIDRALVLPLLLLLVWNMGGVLALLPILYDQDAVTFIATSFYLSATALLFACLISEDVMQRLQLLRAAYISAAVIAAFIGVSAYFELIPGGELFAPEGYRAQSTFKDPNVYGPFLILPLLFLIDAVIRRGFRIPEVALILFLIVGLFLSFSRGAWAHFVLSASLMIILMFVTSVDWQFRARIITFAVMAMIGVVTLLSLLLSIEDVGGMFQQRATLLQEYDAGEYGRFGRQVTAISAVLEAPLGMGALQFARQYGMAPHNVYLNTFLAYGWIGGFAYLALVLTTLWAGLRAVFVRTPWQPYLIAIYATFAGVAAEGIIIDTDHWRHYFLLLGLVWGLVIATRHYVATQRFARLPSAMQVRFSG